MTKVLIPSAISTLAHLVVIFSSNELTAYIAYAFYFSFATWISVFVFDFCIYYIKSRSLSKFFNFVVIPLAVLDTVSLFANIFHHFVFGLYYARWFRDFYLHYIPTGFLTIHVVFGQLLFIISFIALLRRVLKEPPAFRIRYYSILTFVFLIFASNIIYIFTGFPFNFSIIVYAVCFISSYYVLFNVLPRRLIQKTLGLITNNLKSGLVLLDTDKKCIYVNTFIKEIFGCDETTILAQDIFSDFETKKEKSQVYTESTFSEEFDFSYNGKRLILQISDYYIRENDITVGRYYLVEDITETKNQIYEEKILRTRDKLTGLFNQDYFFEKVEHRIKFDRFTQYMLIVTDIVNFKLINDLHGKAFGDTILLRIADSIRTHAASDDIYGRLFNDHFVMFIPKRHFDDKAYIEAFKSRTSYLTNFSYHLIGHMGVYEVDDLSLPVSVMCDRAFLALRTIKNDYMTTLAYYDDRLRLEVLQMQMLMNELPDALKAGQLVMYLQSQVTKDGKLVGAEALVRWHHPTRGVVPPSDFIEIIEKINIISDVDRFVWECACKKLSEWKKAGRKDLTISVNISAKDFFTMDLYEIFTSLVKKYDISPKNLNLEITETAVIFDLDNQMKLIDRLRSAGFIVEMDDFGSGYSSLNMLKDISVDVLKIDMAFLQKSKNNEKSRLILEKIIILAKELGMKVVTEGVESDNQIGFLSDAGCDLFQGFYFSRPIPVADFEEKYFN
ncbi:MAG: EAL domain-containing protein [Treponema sp.]|nr:EAL domain-containing protein [Treponema sp.]